MTDQEAIERFSELRDAWLMEFDEGWWAYCGDERPLGPFASEAEASRAGLARGQTKQ